jgi:NADH-quinone oxidoreductase subunit K
MLVTFVLFAIFLMLLAFCGLILVRKTVILSIISLEILLLAVNFNFTSFALILDDFLGLIVALFVFVIGACESALGLMFLVVLYSQPQQGVKSLYLSKG